MTGEAYTETLADGKTIKVYQDEDATSPREFDQLGVMVHWHRRYNLGDRQAEKIELDALRRGGWALLARYLRMREGAVNVIPLGLLDHSGLHIYCDGGSHWSDSAGWDSGTVGFIYANAETIANTGAPLDSIERQLRGEVDEYDQYLRGDVYGFVIEDADGETLDSCWGFYGMDDCIAEAKASL